MTSSQYDPRDRCSKEGAQKTAQEISDYWLKRAGVAPLMRVVDGPFSATLRIARHDVRSDMRNGLPVELLVIS